MPRIARLTAVALLLAATPLFAAKLDGIYSGSGGLTPELHRVVLIVFADDGTALIQQKYDNRPSPEVWHTRWVKQDDNVTLTFDPVANHPTPKPAKFTFKRNTLTPTTWDGDALGVLGPPQLRPFGGHLPHRATVNGCISINPNDPAQNCVTWDSKNGKRN